ncbi:MAG TPA: helicase-related protein [Candidatus Kapabacteria bacterium]|nr:helicase-related protein [Candidatus Kapabacteria bacterium]
MNNVSPSVGQRWVSDSEPELGLGVIVAVGSGRVEISFPAAAQKRVYALSSAPLRRVAFKEGDRIRTHEGAELVVDRRSEIGGLLQYHTADGDISEAQLSDTISFSAPEERLFAGHVDDLRLFELRTEAIALRSRIAQSPARGYVGGRIDLIPHQLSIAGEVASRLVPRVLLADEVGLGKTIEAGLILHRLHLTGRAERVLVLVPEPLVHQWFVELLRRFNLPFSIYDEDRCEAIEEGDPDANPFLDTQLILCGIDLLVSSERRAAQALEAGWDLLIVDEAHHLEWSVARASTGYRVVEALAASTPGLLLLTATPQQLGPEGHFARLRLLDPDRYADLDRFLEEAERYEAVAGLVDRIIGGETPAPGELAAIAGDSPRIAAHAAELASGSEQARERIVGDLLDSFGTGRVMFRNTRQALSGFPERAATLTRLAPDGGLDEVGLKVRWLAELLRELDGAKVLLICRTRELAETIHERLQHEISVNGALFHEGLSLVQRDRNASYFAEDDGARILICSEIGSEGRNFQFVHHLVLFDLPEDPELLEQRIGRLDRIGQRETVRIHVPYVPGSDSEVLARWYHEGLDAFEHNLHGAEEIARALSAEVASAREGRDEDSIARLVERSREERARVAEKLQHGYDRLLQLNSNKPGTAAELAALIREADTDRSFEMYMVRLLDYYGVTVDDLEGRTYVLRPGHVLTDAFPELPDEGMAVTFDRRRALGREDLAFLTWDHPFVRTVIDLLLDGEAGNASYCVWKAIGGERLYLEITAIVECVAPPSLHVDRFLPPRPLRVVVDHALNDASDDALLAAATFRNGDIGRMLEREPVKRALLPVMLDKGLSLASDAMRSIVTDARDAMFTRLQAEIDRLEDLSQINDNVTTEEIDAMRDHRMDLHAAIGTARLRVGALRVIQRL